MSESCNNLLDIIISQKDSPRFKNCPAELFRYLLINYFFRKEVFDSRPFFLFLEKFPMPEIFSSADDIRDLDPDTVDAAINDETVENSFCGRIMLSKNYLKIFFPNHIPDYYKVPNDVRLEMRAAADSRNRLIVSAFRKLHRDMERDQERKLITLVALIIINLHRRTGWTLINTDKSPEHIIRLHFDRPDDIFTGSEVQMAALNDDSVIRSLLKHFFVVKSFRDMKILSDEFRNEADRFKKRADSAFRKQA